MDNRAIFDAPPVETPQARLELSLLGPPQVSVNGVVVLDEGHQKPLALLAYLAIEAHRPHQRGALVALFWPDQPERQAFQNLRKALYRLRRFIKDPAAEPSHLLVDPQTIQFNSHSDTWLDVTAFTEGVAGVQEHRHRRLDACPICLSKLAQAVEYYRGSFLTGVHSIGSVSFQEWLTIRREQLEQQACLALDALAKSHLAQGKSEAACDYAQRLMLLDPWNEAGHRLLLQALALSEGRNAALLHFEQFRQELADELGVAPEDETLALVDQIQKGVYPGEQLRTPATRHPTPATPFVGREAEREQIAGYLAGYDQRLLTLSGPGGSGKSRLALEIINEQHPLWRDGVWFISLADVPDPESLAGALASTLGYKPNGNLETTGLIEFLKPRETLMILDSYEHLAADTTLIEEILRWAPQVSMLVTSRVRLGIHREWIISLDGLEIPPDPPETLEETENFSAVTLFLQNARRAAPDFHLSEENLPDVLRICRQVEGLPLGIELASAWVRMFPPRKIANEIERSQDFLQNPYGNDPVRLHSLRASFNYSYNLLSETERSLLRQLSIFRGGLTAEACQAITGKEHHHLVSLLDKSLLEASTFGRLGLHLTLREYATEQLAEYPLKQTTTRMQHGAFYLAFLRDREKSLRGKDQKETSEEINLEIGNILTAWGWAVDGAKLGEIKATTPGLALFYTQTSQLREGEIALGSAADKLLSLHPEDLETLRVAGQLRLKQADLLLHRRQLPQLKQVAQESIELAQQAQEVVGEAYGTFYQGAALWLQGEFEPALTQLERARELARKARGEALPDEAPEAASVEGRCLNMMAGACWNLGRFDEAKIHLEEMLSIFPRLGNQIRAAAALSNLGVLAIYQGDYAQAKAHYEQALHIHQEVGNPEGQSVGYVNLGELYLSLGALEEAESHLEEALLIIRKMQSKQRETNVLSNLSQLAHYRGEDETAREYSQQAIQLAEEAGDRNRLGTAWLMLGYALLGIGRLGKSAEAFQLSVDLRRELNQPNLVMESLAGLAQVALNQEDLAKALKITEGILEHLESGSLDGTTDPFQVYLTCYHVLKANHDARASKLLYSANQQLQERAAKMGDEGLRRSYLENVPSQRKLARLVQDSED